MADLKQPFSVNLPAELIRQVKQESIDSQLSLSDWLERLLRQQVEQPPPPDPTPGTAPARVQLQPLVHVEDMAASVDFYQALGATILHGSRDGDFTLLQVGDGQLGLLAHPPNPDQGEGDVELSFESTVALEELETELSRAGAEIVSPPSDEGFGRQLLVRAPGGLLVKINELEPDLYT